MQKTEYMLIYECDLLLQNVYKEKYMVISIDA